MKMVRKTFSSFLRSLKLWMSVSAWTAGIHTLSDNPIWNCGCKFWDRILDKFICTTTSVIPTSTWPWAAEPSILIRYSATWKKIEIQYPSSPSNPIGKKIYGQVWPISPVCGPGELIFEKFSFKNNCHPDPPRQNPYHFRKICTVKEILIKAWSKSADITFVLP